MLQFQTVSGTGFARNPFRDRETGQSQPLVTLASFEDYWDLTIMHLPPCSLIFVAIFFLGAGTAHAQQVPHHVNLPNPLRLHRHAIHEPLGSRIFHSKMHTRNRCCLPAYDYGHDDSRHSASVLARSLPIDETEAIWTTTADLGFEKPVTADDEWPVSRKKFHFPASALVVDHIQLDQVGLAIYETGHMDASGMVFHTGGPLGNLLGNRVAIRLQAFAGPKASGVPLADAPLVWQWQHRFWARRGRRLAVNFAPEGPQPALRRRYNEITHLAVELEYLNDR